MRSFELPGRSPVMTTRAMAATSNPLSTEVAVRIMRTGGNAMDAAIAACAMQCVVEPMSTGIGGDCFAIYAKPEAADRPVAFNGSGRAPAAATSQWYAEHGIDSIDTHSSHAVTVPGAVEAWARLNGDHGRMTLAELLAPAIEAARNGYPVAPRAQYDWSQMTGLIQRDQHTAAIFLPRGKPPVSGDVHRQPQLADTLERIASEGPDAFYKGPVATDMVECLRQRGGLHTMDDFADTAGEYVKPIRTSFHGYDVWQCPPNGQGIAALLILNILAGEQLDPNPLSADRVHLEIEAARLAYRDRDLVADPDRIAVPVDHLLSVAHASHLRRMIDPRQAGKSVTHAVSGLSRDTVYIAVVDSDGNAASFINSLFHLFGSGIVAPRSGVLFHNRGESFSLDPDHPNVIAPRKRPLHTLMPGMLTCGDRVVMPYGVMGGHYQALGHAHLLTRLLDYGLDLQEAMDLPRFVPSIHAPEVSVESTLPATLIDELSRRKHLLSPAPRPIGGAQAIWIDHDRGILIGASDSRKDGCALGY